MAVTDYPGWRSASWFNFALHCFTFTLFAIFYHPKAVGNSQGLCVLKRVTQIDWIGCTLLAAGICPMYVMLVLDFHQKC